MASQGRQVRIEHLAYAADVVGDVGQTLRDDAADFLDQLGNQRVAGPEMNEDRAVGLAGGLGNRCGGRPGKTAGSDHPQAGLDQLATGRLPLEGSGA